MISRTDPDLLIEATVNKGTGIMDLKNGQILLMDTVELSRHTYIYIYIYISDHHVNFDPLLNPDTSKHCNVKFNEAQRT